MDIDSAGAICGLPILEARALMQVIRRADAYGVSVDEVLSALCNFPDAQRILAALVNEGYLQPGDPGCWATTVKGNALAMASTAARLKRSTALRQLEKILARVDEVNDDCESSVFLMRVAEVRLFGSLIDPSRETIGDIDLVVVLEDGPVLETARLGEGFTAVVMEHADEFAPSSWSWFDRLEFPEVQVRRFLVKGTRAHCHEASEIDRLGFPQQIIWPGECAILKS